MLSILIVNWNTRDLLHACLDSIYKHPPTEQFEVVVVDNASSDNSAEMVRESYPLAKLVVPGKNTGYAAGNNLAFGEAKGDWMLTLNPDTEVYENTLQTAIDKLEQHDRYGVLGARQIGTDGKTQSSIRGFPGFWGIVGNLTKLDKLFPGSFLDRYRQHDFDYEKEQPAQQPMGTFLLFKRKALESVGDPRKPFDESFPIFFNEVDLLYRLKQAGWECLYSPDVRIKHLGGESTKQVKKKMIWESHRSLVRFFEKHYRSPVSALFLPLFKGLVYIGALIRARGYDAGFRA